MQELTINGRRHRVDVPPDMPVLWVLRDVVGLTGTKFGCGIAVCGACTVHLDGQPTRSCVTPVSAAVGKSITTIEAIGETPAGKKVQQAWLDLEVVQCGYCQSGQIMQAAVLLAKNKKPTREQIVTHMNGNLCRCGTYNRIVSAIQRAAKEV
jgi:isoquinoline 1-oxidoreductase subunit alpha